MQNDTLTQELLAAHRLGLADFVYASDFTHIFALQAHRNDLHAPQIYSAISVCQTQLNVSFFIEKTDASESFHASAQSPQRADFLWEENCLELFFAQTICGGYIEVNAAPDGRYNIYEFSGYRTPSTLPPVQTHRYQFTWQATNKLAHYHHQQFIIARTDNQPFSIAQLNPTAVLHGEDAVIYYAANHTQPPDFHQQSAWLKI